MTAGIKKYCFFLLFTSAVFLRPAILYSQQQEQLTEEQKIFKLVEEGFNKNSIDKFSSFFSDKIYISLVNGKPKYYSSNQAYYIIKDFLRIYSPSGFKFEFTSSENKFASGILKYVKNGSKGKVNIFVTLQKEKNQLKISNITIN